VISWQKFMNQRVTVFNLRKLLGVTDINPIQISRHM